MKLMYRYLYSFLIILLFSCEIRKTEEKPLNFVFILVDDLGWADLSCYGRTEWETPSIDKLASEGMRFTDAYAASPVCSPTRASILTGKHPARLKVTNWIPGWKEKYQNPVYITPDFTKELKLEELTIAERLKEFGYKTASIGKWHLGSEDVYPVKHGFDEEFLVCPSNVGSRSYYNYGENGEELPDSLGGKYLTELLANKAIKWLDKNKEEPFFLYFSTHVVHAPIQAEKGKVEKFMKLGLPEIGTESAEYAGMCEHMDENIGRLLDSVDELGLRENTVVIFFSDNGGREPETSNAPLKGGKAELHEGGIRVPMIVRWPGQVKENSVCNYPVISNDFVPTIMHLASGNENYPEFDGLSLVELLKENKELTRSALYWHYPHYTGHKNSRPSSAIRKGKYKLVDIYEYKELELYDLSNDIGEHNNIAKQFPDVTANLKAELDKWKKEIGAQEPIVNQNYDSEKYSGW